MLISHIVAHDKNRVIGVNNEMPWNLPNDMKYFMRTTSGHHVIGGRKNFEAMGRRPLRNRTNIILTRNQNYAAEGIYVANDIQQAFNLSRENGEMEVFVIGGGEIYKQSMRFCHKLYVTEIDLEVSFGKNDEVVRYPEIDKNKWQLVSDLPQNKDEKNKFNHRFLVYERKAVRVGIIN